MKETDYQTKICEVVNKGGGFAMKMSHRFLVGVPDLLATLPVGRPSLIEVKFNTVRHAESKNLAVTPLQERMLRKAHIGGMGAGVLSILSRSGTREEGYLIRSIEHFEPGKFPVLIADHSWGTVSDRGKVLWSVLEEWFSGRA